MHTLFGMTAEQALRNIVDPIAWLYVVTNSLRVFFYAPQIRAVWKATDGALSVSITTWAFWTVSNLTATLYGVLVIHDRAFTAIFMCNCICTAAVVLIAAGKRLGLRTSRNVARADGTSLA